MTNSKAAFIQSLPPEACYTQDCPGTFVIKDLIHHQPTLGGRPFGPKVWCVIRDCPVCNLHTTTPVNYIP